MAAKIDRVLLAHTWLARGSLVWALVAFAAPTWQGHSAPHTVLNSAQGPLAQMTYAAGAYGVTLQKNRGPNGATQVLLRHAGARDETPTTPSRWRGTAAATALIDTLAQMPALRALGPMTPEQLRRFGLAPPQATLTWESDQTRIRVALGTAVYGSGDLYAYVPDRGAYVIDAARIAPLLHGATDLIDRRLGEVDEMAVTRMTLKQHGRTQVYVRATPDAAPQSCLVDAAQPSRCVPQAQALVSRLVGLRVVGEAGEAPLAPSDAEVRLDQDDGGALQAVLYLSADKEPQVTCAHQVARMVLTRAAADAVALDLSHIERLGPRVDLAE